MEILTIVTVVYLAILILAVAAGLIAIIYFLGGASHNLAKIGAGLAAVRDNVEPLGPALTAINGGLVTVLGDLRAVDRDLAEVDARFTVAR